MDASKLTVHEADLLGEGGFARVFKATIDLGARHGGKQEVAFKQLFESVKSLGAQALAAELLIQSKVN